MLTAEDPESDAGVAAAFSAAVEEAFLGAATVVDEGLGLTVVVGAGAGAAVVVVSSSPSSPSSQKGRSGSHSAGRSVKLCPA